MKLKHFGLNLAEKSKIERDSKRDEICFGLFCFLKLYKIKWSLLEEQNQIDNLDINNNI